MLDYIFSLNKNQCAESPDGIILYNKTVSPHMVCVVAVIHILSRGGNQSLDRVSVVLLE